MVEERILDAVERIDGAMSRIEEAARRVADKEASFLVPSAATARDPQIEDLKERHQTMRTRVKSAIEELDALIARG